MALLGRTNRFFLVTVAPKVCQCQLPPRELHQARTIDKAMLIAAGYYSLFLTFFGEQGPWLNFSVIDIRDGQVLWRNGRQLGEEKNSG